MRALKDSLAGRVAFVTGAGTGMGKNAAKLLAYAGAKVAVLADNREEIEATAHEIMSNGHEALPLTANVSENAEMERAVARIREKWGRLDFVVANAGINGAWGPIEELSVEEWDLTMNVDLRGTFLAIKHAVPLLKKQGGAIVITSSVNGTRIFSNSGATPYSCAKAGQVAMAKMLAVELGPHKIRVNVICPGGVKTKINTHFEGKKHSNPQIPVEFPKGHSPLTGDEPGTSGEVAELIWFLCSDFADHITGTEVYIDGAQSLLQG